MTFGYVGRHLSLILPLPYRPCLFFLLFLTLPLEVSLWFLFQHLFFAPARSMMFMSSPLSCIVVMHVEKFICRLFLLSSIFRTGLGLFYTNSFTDVEEKLPRIPSGGR